jgi:anti-anti-sigma factor
MSITKHYDDTTGVLSIKINGDFDSYLIDSFSSVYKEADEKTKIIEIDLNDSYYIDSSALGILIALREYAQEKKILIHIKNIDDVILDIFRVLNFHHLFKPEYDKESGETFWCFRPDMSE